jgi:hypothetical protein
VSRYGVDPNEGLQEAANHWLAESADDLRRVLVLHPPIRLSTAAGEALGLLEKFRATEPDTIVQTAVLLLTDPRWKGACGQVIRGIESRDLLEDEHLDLLATTFLAADDAVYWAVPDEWFEGGAVIVLDDEGRVEGIDPDDVDPDEAETDEVETDDVDSDKTVARREVQPPLRRWAAERVVRGDPSFWPGVMKRSDELGARRGAFVALGLLDALDVLPDATQGLLVEKATRARDQAVRSPVTSVWPCVPAPTSHASGRSVTRARRCAPGRRRPRPSRRKTQPPRVESSPRCSEQRRPDGFHVADSSGWRASPSRSRPRPGARFEPIAQRSGVAGGDPPRVVLGAVLQPEQSAQRRGVRRRTTSGTAKIVHRVAVVVRLTGPPSEPEAHRILCVDPAGDRVRRGCVQVPVVEVRLGRHEELLGLGQM